VWQFPRGKPIYMKVPEGFEKHYPGDVLLLLLSTIYGLYQAARAFWWELTAVLEDMGYLQSPADPCLYFSWTMTCDVTFRIDQFESRIADDFGGGQQRGS